MSDAKKIIGQYTNLSISTASGAVTIVITIEASSANDIIAALGMPEIGKHIELCLPMTTEQKIKKLLMSTQCAMRCNSPDFQQWIVQKKLKHTPLPEHQRDAVVDWVRNMLGINSRKELDENKIVADHWVSIDEEYLKYNQHYLWQRKP